MRLTIIFVVLFCAHLCVCDPFIKVFCSGAPLFRGRADSIVSPGIVSGHVHKVSGGSNFSPASASQSPLQVYNDMLASPCTTCSIKTVDNSAYWHPDLYYQWPNGSLSLVPNGGLTVYYLARSGSGDQAHPAWKAFPPGFRMVSGNPFRRTYNPNSVADQAVSYACLSSPGGPETHDLSVTKTRFCSGGLRMQVHFPQCWDGVRLDTPNHMDHVAFPERPDGGNCPSTHPYRLFNLFFEAFYSVDKFPHGDGTQRFVLACGDATGYGFHGDFLNGWNQNVLQSVLTDPSCDTSNTNLGNNPERCNPIKQYVQGAPPAGSCSLNHKIPLTEDLGIGHTLKALPGCNPITGAGASVTPCSAAPSAGEKAPISLRFHLRSELTQKYLTCPSVNSNPLTANVADPATLTYNEVFTAPSYPGGYVSIVNEGPNNNFLSASGPNNAVLCNRGSPSDWESFQIVPQANGKVAIRCHRDNSYLSTSADGTITSGATTIGTAQLFTQVAPTGGSAF